MKIEDNPKFKKLNPTKQKIILEIKRSSENKNLNALLPEIMKVNQELTRRNMAFSAEERELLFSAVKESLDPEEQKNFDMVSSLIKTYSH